MILSKIVIRVLLCTLVLLSSCINKGKDSGGVVVIKNRPIPFSPWHVVAEGETVEDVARKYGMSRKELIELNGLTPPYRLYESQKLMVARKYLASDLNKRSDKVKSARTDSSASTNTHEEEDVRSQQISSSTQEASNPHTTENILQSKDEGNSTELTGPEIVWPIHKGWEKIIQHFSGSKSGDGILIKVRTGGEEVLAVMNGDVIFAKVPEGEAAAYGKTVIIKHSGIISVYSHLDDIEVRVGDKIRAGGMIGFTGTSNNNMYFAIFKISKNGKEALNPETFLNN